MNIATYQLKECRQWWFHMAEHWILLIIKLANRPLEGVPHWRTPFISLDNAADNLNTSTIKI
jgi:hypothetical protein